MESASVLDMLWEYLKEKKIINELEQDILSTIETYMQIPFDRDKGEKKIIENNVKHIDICCFIPYIPGIINKPFNQADDVDIKSNLYFQIEAMAIKDGLGQLIQTWKNM